MRKKHSGGLNHAMNESMGGAAYLRNGVRRLRRAGVELRGGSSGWVGGVTYIARHLPGVFRWVESTYISKECIECTPSMIDCKINK